MCILYSISAHSMFTAVLFCYQKNNIVEKLLNQELTFDCINGVAFSWQGFMLLLHVRLIL